MKKTLKIIRYISTGILLFLLMLFLLLSTGALNPVIKRNICTVANHQINGTLSIEKLSGHLFSNFNITNLQISDGQDTIIKISTLKFNYKIFDVLQHHINVDSIVLDNPTFLLTEKTDSIWNIQQLISSPKSTPTDTLPSKWKININNFIINKLESRINPLDSTSSVPKNINGNLHLNLEYASDKLQMNVRHFNLTTQNPYFHIVNMTMETHMDDAIFYWNNLNLQLEQSNFTSQGYLPLSHPEHTELTLKASPFDTEDIKPWMKDIYGKADITVTLDQQNDSSLLNVEIHQASQHLKLTAHVWEFETLPQYKVTTTMDSLNMAYWTHQPDFKSLINGVIDMEGSGFDLKQNTLLLQGELADHYMEREAPSMLSFLLKKDQGDVNSRLNGSTLFGDIRSEIQVTHLFDIPEYNGNIDLKHINLAKLSSNPRLESDLNLIIDGQGTDIKMGKMTSFINVQSSESVLFGQALEEIKTTLHINKEHYTLNTLHLKTPYLEANIKGSGNLSDKNNLQFNVKLQNIEKLLTTLGQEPFKFNGGISGNLNGPIDHLNLEANLVIDEMDNDTLKIKDMQTHLQSAFSYGVIDKTKKRKTSINDISDITLENISLKTNTLADQITFKNHTLNKLELELNKNKGTIKGKTFTQAFSGSLETDFKIINAFTIPEYNLQASVKEFDLATLTKKDSLYSAINLELLVEGKSLNTDSLDLVIQIKSKDSKAFGHSVDKIDSKIIYKQDYYNIDNLVIKSPFIDAEIKGEGNINTDNELYFWVDLKDLDKLKSSIIPENIDFTGQINGSILGALDSLNATSHIDIQHFKMDTIQVENMKAEASLEIRDSAYSGFINVNLLNSTIQELKFKDIQLTSNFTQDSAQNSFTYYSSDSLNGTVTSTLIMEPLHTLYFKKIALTFEQDTWLGGSENSYICFRQDSIEINALEVRSKEGSLKANGLFTFDGNEKLEIEVNAMDLRRIAGIQLSPLPISGNLNAGLSIKGSSKTPIINGFVTIENPIIDTLQLKRMGITMSYANEHFNLESYIDEQHAQLMHSTIEMPYQLSFNKNMVLPDNKTPLSAELILNQFDLGRINPYLSLEGTQTQGILNAKIQLNNTISQPNINGNININKGEFKYNTLGMKYNNILLNSKIINNDFQLDSLTLSTAKGKLQFKGMIESDSLFQGDIETIDLNMQGSNFKLFDSEMASALINTNLDIKGTPEKPVFKGNLTMLKSAFNVDLFMKKYNRVYDNSEEPMLIVARTKNKQTLNQPEKTRDSIQKSTPDILKNLKGSFDIAFPRNTWIKGKNMNFELFGNIKAIKEDEKISFFGTLDVKRGYYKIYGRQLDFESGEVTFTGGSSINPKLDFKVNYTFRDSEKNLRELSIIISDRLIKPTITFFIDDVSIEEKEAISYLLFNKSLDQLNTKENSSLNSANLNLILNQISGVVKDVLQSKLGLDVFEISSDDSWSQSTISTGKYLTNNIYLNYERTFTIDKKDKEIQPQKITLEYQLYRSLFIQATNQNTNSGFDLIYKWSKK